MGDQLETEDGFTGYRDPSALHDPVCVRCGHPPYIEGDRSTCDCYTSECPMLFVERRPSKAEGR